jgi:DNA polymerase-1
VSGSAKDKLLLVDGLSMAFRAFFALPVENFATSTGAPTNAVYGFTSMLASLLADRQPTHVAVAFDLPGGTFRTERLPSYKGTRDATPPEFEPQVPLMREVLAALNVAAVDKERYEADDLLATYARMGREAGMEVLVVSGDRDTIQLVTDDVTLLYPRKGVSDLVEFTPAAVAEKYGVTPSQYPDLAALVGETSDNLPGVPGVGPKTAAKWINTYGGLEGILAAAADVPGKAGESLRQHLDQVRLNREINHLLTDLEVSVPLEDMRLHGGDAAAIHQVCDALQFRGLRARLLAFAADAPEADAVADEAAEVTLHVPATVEEIVALPGPVALCVPGRDAWALGVAAGDEAWAVDLASLTAAQEQSLARWLGEPTVAKAMHGAKNVLHALADRGFTVAGLVEDTQLGAYLVNPAQGRLDLDDVAERFLGIRPPHAAEGQLDLGLGRSELEGLARAAHTVTQLATHMAGEIDERQMTDLYRQMEIPLVSTLFDMERVGVAVDTTRLTELYDAAIERVDRAASAAYDSIGGVQVNLGSPKQLQDVLFEQLGMPKTKRIKTGYSTDAASLVELFEKQPHPFLEALLAHRDATKLAQIIQTLRDAVASDGRIHTTFSQVVAATGRLSSKDPNLQNIPIRTEEGHRIREAFVVGPDYATLVTADYSQIEMRIMAHLSGDEALIAAFAAGEDLHRFVGSRVFGVAPEDVSGEMRAQVKAMSYGLAYGLSSFGLSRQLGLSVGAAQALMDDYFARFGAVRDYLNSVVRQATKDGYTATIFGRRRYLPDLASTNRQRREMAERMALNAPIQGSAADLIKRAMLAVDARIEQEGLRSRQILQVHDELVIEAAAGEEDAVETILREEMAAAGDLSVPLDVNVGRGTNWRVAGH